MNFKTAARIADLLNSRNKLPTKLDAGKIFDGNYFYIVINEGKPTEEILACARSKCMSFFCYELKHLAVNEKYEKQGLGKMMIGLVETFVKEKKIPILLATTRIDNDPVIGLFSKLGYQPTKQFTNSGTKNPCIVWRKDLL